MRVLMHGAMLLAVLALAGVGVRSADLGALRWSSAALRPGAVAVSANGSLVAVAESFGIGIYATTHGTTPAALLTGHAAGVTALAFVPNETLLASASADGTVRTWDYLTGGARRVLTVGSPVTCLAVTLDGTIAAGAENGAVYLFRALDGAALGTLAGHDGPVAAVAVSADGYLVSAGRADGKLTEWRLATRTATRTVTPAPGLGILLAATTGLGTPVIAIDEACDVWTWTIGTNTLERDSFPAMEYPTALVASGPTQGYIGFEQGGIGLCDTAANALSYIGTAHAAGPIALGISWDCTTLASASAEGTVKVWRPGATLTLLRTIARTGGEVGALARSSQGVVAVAKADTVDKAVRLLDGATGASLGALTCAVPVDSLAFSPDGATLAVGSLHKAIELWNVAGKTRIRSLTSPADVIDCIAWSPDGQYLAAGAWNMFEVYAHINVYRAGDGALLKQIFPVDDETMGTIDAIAWSPDGTTLATVGYDQAVRLWRVSDGAETVLDGHAGYPQALAFSPDGAWLVSGDFDGQVRLWDTRDYTTARVLETGLDGVMALAVTPDGAALAAAGFDGAIALYRLSDGARLRTQAGHTGAVYGLAFAPGGVLMAGGTDGVACWQALLAQPDARIRAAVGTGATWAGNNVYAPNTGGQTRAETVAADAPARFVVRLENDGPVTDTFTLTGTSSGNGATVSYAWADAPGDITTAVTGGLTLTLAPGASRDLLVAVSVAPAAAGTARAVSIRLASARSPAADDQVTALVTRITAPTSATLTTEPGAKATLGHTVRLTASHAAAPPCEYLFRVGAVTGGVTTWTTARGYRPDPTFDWTPTAVGSYYLEVNVRVIGTKQACAAKRIDYTIAAPTPPLTGVTLTAGPAGVLPGGTVTLTPRAIGGGTPEYLFRVTKVVNGTSNWSLLRGFRTAPTCPWTPTERGTYVLEVQAREYGTRTVTAWGRVWYTVGD